MMTNFGDTIKNLARVLIVIGLISCVILFFIGNAAYQEDKDYIEYATVYGGARGYSSLQEAGDNAYNGLQLRNLSITLAISIAVAYLPLYGFGVLIDNSEQQTDMIRRSLREMEKNNELMSKLESSVASTSRQVSEATNTAAQLLIEQRKINENFLKRSVPEALPKKEQQEIQVETTQEASNEPAEVPASPLRRRIKQC